MEPTIIFHPLPPGYLIIHEELETIDNELTNTGRWCVYYSPSNCTFFMELDNETNWVADESPVSQEVIDEIGRLIEERTA